MRWRASENGARVKTFSCTISFPLLMQFPAATQAATGERVYNNNNSNIFGLPTVACYAFPSRRQPATNNPSVPSPPASSFLTLRRLFTKHPNSISMITARIHGVWVCWHENVMSQPTAAVPWTRRQARPNDGTS
uniref:Putative secreted protein n=1 Tax=Anopheles darlingi TaxID=43151 RepID=A0A2M4DG91_ANODA